MTRSRTLTLVEALSLLIVGGSVSLTISQTLRLDFESPAARLSDASFVAAAVLSIVLALGRSRSKFGPPPSALVAGLVALGGASAAFGAVVVHSRELDLYTKVAAGLLGASLLALTVAIRDDAPLAAASARPSLLDPVWVFVTGSAIALRFLSPDSAWLEWVVAPVFVMVMPGWSLGALLLPIETGWMERLFWAPVLSIGALVLALIWLDWAGITITPISILVVTVAVTLAGVALGRLR